MRHISDSLCKVFAKIIVHRMGKVVEENEILGEIQISGRTEHRTLHHLITPTSIIDERRVKSQVVILAFVELRKILDTVNRT